jgi:EamA domain-containing membrane protein RarD
MALMVAYKLLETISFFMLKDSLTYLINPLTIYLVSILMQKEDVGTYSVVAVLSVNLLK